MSRTPVREALLQLQNEGLVVIKPQSGTFVFDLTRADLHHICQARAIFETGALRFALAEGSPEPLAALGALVGRAAVVLEDGDLDQCDALDWKFHEGLIASTGNRFLIKAYSAISLQLRTLRHLMPSTPARVGEAIRQHRRILDLCAAGRVDDAVHQLNGHIKNAEHLLAQVESVFSNPGERPSSGLLTQ